MGPSRPWAEMGEEPTYSTPDDGLRYLEMLLQKLIVDEEWLVRDGRTVRWWGGPMPMTITASEPRVAFGDPTIKLF